jgi:anti-sigma B factor antagonist
MSTARPHRPTRVVTTVTITEVDRHTVEAFRAELEVAVAAFPRRDPSSGPAALLVDLRGLRFLDSSGVRALLDAERDVQAFSGHLEVLVSPGPVKRVLEVTGVLERWCPAD